MKVEKKTIVTQGNRNIPYTYIQNNSPVVCFMFSGAGYTYEKPLFYYSTMVMLDHGYDVVHIHYSYNQRERKLPYDELADLLVEDVTPVMKEVMKKREYEETIFLGKSLGTIPILSKFAIDRTYSDSKMILLTPLLQYEAYYKRVLESRNKTLLIIGNADPHYIPAKISKLSEKTNFTIKEIAHANHSLDVEPFATSSSISVLHNIMISVKDFVHSD